MLGPSPLGPPSRGPADTGCVPGLRDQRGASTGYASRRISAPHGRFAAGGEQTMDTRILDAVQENGATPSARRATRISALLTVVTAYEEAL